MHNVSVSRFYTICGKPSLSLSFSFAIFPIINYLIHHRTSPKHQKQQRQPPFSRCSAILILHAPRRSSKMTKKPESFSTMDIPRKLPRRNKNLIPRLDSSSNYGITIGKSAARTTSRAQLRFLRVSFDPDLFHGLRKRAETPGDRMKYARKFETGGERNLSNTILPWLKMSLKR